MISAFGRLIFIAGAAVLWIILALFGLRTCGQTQMYGPATHPLLNNQSWVVAMGGDTTHAPMNSRPAFAAAANLSENIFLGAKVRLTKDEQWIVYGFSELQKMTNGRGLVSQSEWANIKKLNFLNSTESPMLFEELLTTYPNARLLIDVLQPASSSLPAFYKLIEKHKAEKRIVLTSPFYDTLRDIREHSAHWLTAHSTSEVSRSQFMNSLFLESLITLNGEVFSASKLHPRLISELVKRQKVVLYETDDPAAYAKARELAPTLGVVTNRPSLFINIR